MFSVIIASLIQISPLNVEQQNTLLTLKILVAGSVLIIAAIVLFIIYTKDFIQNLDKLSLHECVPRDITTLNVEKNIAIGLDADENGCTITEIREIRNHMPHDYNRYLFSHRMSHAPPTFDLFKYYLEYEKEPHPYTMDDLNFEIDEPKSRDQDILKYKVEYKFPVQIKPHENRRFCVKFPSHSFKDALQGKMDWIEFDVNSITEKFQIEIKLVDGKQNDYYLDYPPHPKDNDGARYDIEIRDYSRQRMWTSEISLKNENIMPVFCGLPTSNTLKWVVYHPKIGYKYRMYFTVKKKIETVTSTQTSLSETTS